MLQQLVQQGWPTESRSATVVRLFIVGCALTAWEVDVLSTKAEPSGFVFMTTDFPFELAAFGTALSFVRGFLCFGESFR